MIDFYDVLVILGLVMLGAGLWWISPPVALIVIGALLIVGAFLLSWMRAGRPAKKSVK